MISAQTGWTLTTSSNASGVTTGATLWRTTNGARTWVREFREAGSLLAWAAPAAERAWVVLQAHPGRHFQVWVTEDGSAYWHAVTLVAPWSGSVVTVSLTVSASGVGSLLASGPVGTQTGPQALWRITDNIMAPTPVYANANTAFGGAGWATPLDGWMTANSSLINDQAGVLFRTTDGGRQWTPVALPIPASVPSPANGHPQDIATLVLTQAPTFLTSADGYLVATLNDGTITGPQVSYPVLYQTTNDQTWAPVWVGASNQALVQLQWVDAQHAWALLDPQNSSSTRSSIVTTATSGRSWSSPGAAPDASANPTYDLVALSPTQAVAYAVLPSGRLRVYTTTDGGHTWQAGR